MKLQTQIPIKKQSKNLIDYTSKILLLGSCFSENIGQKFAYYQFQTSQNPFGILFHPKAIENLLLNAANKKVYTEKDLFFNNERWHCFEAHSVKSTPDKNQLVNNLNTAILSTNKNIKEATHIVITLGTSWVYNFRESNTIVANCHKIPQKKFDKKLLSIHQITTSLQNSITQIRTLNTSAKIIFTVSPVRHLKDGFIENTQSKAHLITAIHLLQAIENVLYFPSYEIMMDELRDYRFYAEDMIHPNATAIHYIWEKFLETWVSENSKGIMKEVALVQKGLLHKPFNKNAEEHQQFLEKLELKKENLRKQFPFFNF